VALLPVEPEILGRFEALALRTLGDIAALPRPAVEAQFRGAGRRIWKLANGIDREPLRPRAAQESVSERLTFDSPVVATEALVMAARQIVRRLAQRLDRRAARRMHIQVLADDRIIWERHETFREATADEDRMMLVVRTRLAMLTLAEAADTVVITVSSIGREAAQQRRLIGEVNPQLDQVADAIRQIRARYGRPAVWRAVEVDPWSRHPEERSALIPYDA
jgi:nucleotidyltransferase/DNA polymerase involved in DNA repair